MYLYIAIEKAWAKNRAERHGSDDGKCNTNINLFRCLRLGEKSSQEQGCARCSVKIVSKEL